VEAHSTKNYGKVMNSSMNVTKQNSRVNESTKGVASKGMESQPTQVHILEYYTTKLEACKV